MRHALCFIEVLHRTQHAMVATAPNATISTTQSGTVTVSMYLSENHANRPIGARTWSRESREMGT